MKQVTLRVLPFRLMAVFCRRDTLNVLSDNDGASTAQAQTWDHGLVARWWAEFNIVALFPLTWISPGCLSQMGTSQMGRALQVLLLAVFCDGPLLFLGNDFSSISSAQGSTGTQL
jgi:hypothetical protein